MFTKLLHYFLLIIFIIPTVSYGNELINFNVSIDAIEFKGIKSKKIKKEISTIKLKTHLKQQINKTNLNNDLKKLYSSGYFESIQAESLITKNMHILEFIFKENSNINNINIEVKSKKIKKVITKEFHSLLNQPLNTSIVNTKKEKVTALLDQKGYSFFSISSIKFDKQKNQLTIKTSEGTIDKISFIGLNKLDKDLILRSMKQKPGNALNTKEIRKDRERLIKLGYFSFVSSPEFKKGSTTDSLEIIFKLIETKPNKVSLGIEQDQNLFYGFISTIKQGLFMSSDNLFLKSQIQINENNANIKNYLIKYSQPWLFNKYNTRANLSNYNLEKAEIVDNNSTYSQRNGIELSISRPIGYQSEYSISFKSESVSETDESFQIDHYKLNSVNFSILFETVPNKINPSKGYSFKTSLEQGNDLKIISLGGITFTKTTSALSNYFKLSKNLVLATHISGGVYNSPDATKTFENEYFVLGGSTSLRGYSDFNDTITGERNLLTNLELRYNTTNTTQFVTFFDYGNAFNSSINFNDFKSGYGVGFRYITPIGPIRLDIAKGNKDYFVHIGLGQLF